LSDRKWRHVGSDFNHYEGEQEKVVKNRLEEVKEEEEEKKKEEVVSCE